MDARLTSRLMVRFSPSERAVIESVAGSQGLSPSSFVRSVVVRALTEVTQMSPPTRVYVRNVHSNEPHYVEVLLEPVQVRGETLFHPRVVWDHQARGAEPYEVFSAPSDAVTKALERASTRWKEQFGYTPKWCSAEEFAR